MTTYDVFLSHAPADTAVANELKTWLNAFPLTVCPADSSYLLQARVCLVLLSVPWLLSDAGPQHLAQARQAGRQVLVLVHPEMARTPSDSTTRGQHAELQQTLSGHSVETLLRAEDWLWPRELAASAPSWESLALALRARSPWAARHARLAERSARWQQKPDASLLLQGAELSRELQEALLGDPQRSPALSREQLAFLLASQQAEAADSQRLAALCWGAQAQAAALAAQQHAQYQPELALALAAAATEVADVPQTRYTLLSLMERYPGLQRVFHYHPTGRPVCSISFSPDGHWLATADTRSRSQPDDTRPARLNLIHLETLTVREAIQTRAGQIGALAWGRPWLAVGSRGSINWVRWDDVEQRFGSRSPRALNEQVLPMWMAWSGPSGPGGGDWLLWGSLEGVVGLSRPGTGPGVRHYEFRLRNAGQREALQGVAWMGAERILTVERNEVFIRPLPTLEPPMSLGTVDQVHSFQAQNGHWMISCVQRGRAGMLRGYLDQVRGFEPLPDAVQGPFAAADLNLGTSSDPTWLVMPRTLSKIHTLRFGDQGKDAAKPLPALSIGRFINELSPLLPAQAGQPAFMVVDPLRRRIALGDETSGRVWLWEHGAVHPLLKPSLPHGSTEQMCTGADDQALWVDVLGAVHIGVADAGQKPDRLNAGFKVARMVSMNNGSSALLLGQKAESLALDLMNLQARPVRWPQPLQRDTLHLVACADRAARTAMVDGSGWLWLLEGEPHAWRQIGQWQVPGQALAVALSPLGDQVYVQVAQGFFRIGRWTLGGSDEPEWVMVLRNGKPGPMALHEDGSLVEGDGHELYLVPPSSPAEPPVLLPGHDTPITHVASRDGLTLSVAGRDQHGLEEDLWLWSAEGQLLGRMALPDKLASLSISRGGRFAWMRTVGGGMWRLPLKADSWARQAQAMAGRDLNPAERRIYGLSTAHQRMPVRAPGAAHDD